MNNKVGLLLFFVFIMNNKVGFWVVVFYLSKKKKKRRIGLRQVTRVIVILLRLEELSPLDKHLHSSWLVARVFVRLPTDMTTWGTQQSCILLAMRQMIKITETIPGQNPP